MLVAAVSVGAELLGAGQAYLLVALLVGNAALAARRWFNQQQVRTGSPHSASDAQRQTTRIEQDIDLSHARTGGSFLSQQPSAT